MAESDGPEAPFDDDDALYLALAGAREPLRVYGDMREDEGAEEEEVAAIDAAAAAVKEILRREWDDGEGEETDAPLAEG